ncbi:uncharacterized protein LOC107620097 [Arachis ipaensis]|uniref:uncharacterized protein LOC107620097 n=1 Tax=Arachis ipaensis TaxID=130454 RepID=UPI000A2B7288|nr:uncharacterized protein LOC107620097 [Arachis ipaensis]
MATSYDSINSITYSRLCNENVRKIKARIIRLWKVPSKFDKSKTAYLEMVLIDDKCDKIHCSVKNYLAKMFENDMIEEKVYVFSNFLIEESSGIYLPTTHVYRITFKKESRIVNTINDRNIPDNHFNFLNHADILRQTNEKANLFDVIGLLTEKGKIISWSKARKSGHYIVVDLHDLQYVKI